MIRINDNLNTVRGLVSSWAPPSENDTAGYIAGVAKDTGYGADQKLDMHNPEVMRKVIAAMAKRETSALPEATIRAGVNMVLPEAAPAAVNVAAAARRGQCRGSRTGGERGGGAGAVPVPPQTQTIKGSADLKIKISTDPGLSSKTTATTSGDVFCGAPKISQAMAY